MHRKNIVMILLVVLVSSCSEDVAEPEDNCALVEEGAIDIHYTDWSEASPPLDLGPDEQYPADMMAEQYWFEAFEDCQHHMITDTRDLNPAISSKNSCPLTALFIRTIDPTSGEWCGIMRGFPGGLDISGATALEIWINDFDTISDPAERGGILHIDFGRIDEDFYLPDSVDNDGFAVWQDEDLPPYGWVVEEDIGFPGESCSHPTDFSCYRISEVLYTYPGIDCRRRNGRHDTEDLNGNGYLETANSYYTVEIPLSAVADIDVQRDYDKVEYADYWDDAPENELKAWRLYRITMAEWEFVSDGYPPPRLDRIPHMRIWISDVEHLGDLRGSVIEVALIRFVTD